MTTTTQAAQITLPTAELRAILAALDEYTSADKYKPALQLAQVQPIIVEHTDPNTEPRTVLEWQATNSTELVSITHEVAHTLTEPAHIDPAAILTSMKAIHKNTATKPETVLTLTADAWQLTNGPTTSTGQRTNTQWPNTFGLWQNQQPGLAPFSIGAPMIARLAKLAKHLNTEQVNAVSMAHTDNKPDPRRPLVYTVTGGTVDARVLIMPRRPAGE